MRCFLLIIFCFPVVLFSQKKQTILFEGGISCHQPFQKEETTHLDWDSNSYSHIETKRNTNYSMFLKLGFERPIKKKEHFSFSIPIILGYREEKLSYSDEITQVYYYNTAYFYIQTHYYTRLFGLIFGPKVSVDFEKWSFFSAININSEIFLFGQRNTITINDYGTSKQSVSEGLYNVFDVSFNPSIQNCLLHHFTPKVSVGLTTDIFLYYYHPQDSKYLRSRNDHLFNFGYGKYSTIVNAGIRFQYSF